MEKPVRKNLPAQTVICMKHRGSYDEIGDVYHELNLWAKEKGVAVTGKGVTVFISSPNELDWNSAEYEVCLPVRKGTDGDDRITVRELSGCSAACAEVRGPYSKIPAHYTELLAWLDAEGWEISGPPREVYLERHGDEDSYVTEIQFPVQED